jgi:fructose-specific phosphotransferase system IIA component
MGMMVNLFAMANRAALLFGLAYTIICIFGKIIGCGLPPLALNFNLRGAMRIGLGMIPRGEVALLITAIGLAAGILNQDVLGSVVFMTMATTLITPSVLSLSLRSSKPVLRKAIETKETRKHITFDMPNTETTDLLLGKIISALHGDGFYIHRTDTGEDISRLYHLQKDQTSIGMQKFSTKIEFDCKEQESVFVHTLVYEVLFDVENTIKQLQALTDIESIGKKIFDKANGKVLQKKDFTKYILPSGVDVDLKGNTKQDIIKEMIGLLVKSGQLRDEDKDAVFGEVMKREEIMSTGMQDGIAIPHAKTDAVKQVVCAAALKKGGVDFKSLDGKPSYIFILILSPKDITGPHIRFMADISQLLLDEERRQRLVSSRTKEELYRAITLT